MTSEKMLGVRRISIDWENNGEKFWTEIQRRAEGGDSLAKELEWCGEDHDSLYLPTAKAKKLMAYAKKVPGYADGPAHAREAINMYEVFQDEQESVDDFRERYNA